MKADPEMPPSYDGLLLLSWDICYRGRSALPGAALPVPCAEEFNVKAMLRTLGCLIEPHFLSVGCPSWTKWMHSGQSARYIGYPPLVCQCKMPALLSSSSA